MCPIYMDTFTWQVFATFVAAGCALLVGWRQVGIADRQASIAAGQRTIAEGQAATATAAVQIAEAQAATARAAVQIAEAQALTARLAQRGALFDRRLKVYNVVRDYIQIGLQGDPLKLFEIDQKVKDALNEARFLFPETVNRSFLTAFELADECADMTHDRRTSMAATSAERLRELRHQLRAIVAELAKTMGDEMKLFVDPSSSPFADEGSR